MKQFSVVILIFGLISAFFLAGVINKTLLYPIFGNVADWTMVLVTIVTAYFLYETLQSQKDVQRDQAKVNKIETYKHRKELKPNLKFEPLESTFANQTIKLSITDNAIHKLHISSDIPFKIADYGCENEKKARYSCMFKRLDPKSPNYIDIIILFNEKIIISEIDGSLLNFADMIIKYEDEFGFSYEQDVIIIFDKLSRKLQAIETSTMFL